MGHGYLSAATLMGIDRKMLILNEGAALTAAWAQIYFS